MAGPKKKGRAVKPYQHVKSGGYPGDPDMEALEKFAREGCGVSEDVEDVGSEPNAKFIRDIGPEVV